MTKNWDYILEESKYHRTLFRLYPKQTSIHSFGEELPNDWKDVYKVYYSWAIIRQHKNNNGNIESESSQRLMCMHCDECSSVVDLHHIIRWIIKEQKEYNQPTWGQPAGDWRIEISKGVGLNDKPYEYYNFQVFDNWKGNGFRFTLDKQQTEDFANWLEQMNNRALKVCGCPI